MPPEEIFHEDVLATTIFFMVAGFGLLQIMIGYRRWDGLALWGSRVLPRVNYAVGGLLVAASFAWYFADPDHRNVRNIEGLMSVVCLVAGVLAAFLLAAVLPSLAASVNRRRRRRADNGGRDAGLEVRHKGDDGLILAAGAPATGGSLKVLVSDSDGATPLLRRAGRYLAGRDGAFVLVPRFRCEDEAGAELTLASLASLLERLASLCREAGAEHGNAMAVDLIGVGLGADLVRHAPLAGAGWSLTRKTAVKPRFGDGAERSPLRAYCPSDILAFTARERPWATRRARRVLVAWACFLLLSIPVGELIMAALHVRWWSLSGLIGGVGASLWLTVAYLLLRGDLAAPDRVEQLSRMRLALAALPAEVPPEGLRIQEPLRLWDSLPELRA